MLPLILGSQSPRRKEIMGYFDFPFLQCSPNFHEESVPFNGKPAEFALEIALGKSDSLAKEYRQHFLITADTVVFQEGYVFGKPGSIQEARDMLKTLSGKWHSVFTGVVVRKENTILEGVEETRVLFNELTSDHISHYLEKLTFKDKAGGYAIQSAGGLIVNRIEGCYYNVMGLPINTLYRLLFMLGLDLWKALK